jgi:hypothetical protein
MLLVRRPLSVGNVCNLASFSYHRTLAYVRIPLLVSVAKVLRDSMITHWEYSEDLLEARQSPDKQFGSGYPSDPVCQSWLERNCEALFGYSDAVRFSWAPIKKALCGGSSSVVVQVDFSVDDDEDQIELNLRKHSLKRQRDNLLGFLKSKRSPFPYFENKKLRVVSKL